MRITRPSLLKSVCVYDGPSALDGERIVALVTGGGDTVTRNGKTGPLAQLWILRADVAPHVAVRDGRDATVCGMCPQRPALGGDCYVETAKGPRSAWQAWHDGKVPYLHPLAASAALAVAVKVGRINGLRLGAYGDPAALPLDVVADLVARARRADGITTGYTHQWRTAPVAFRSYVMASADSAQDQADARAMGYRSFRVVKPTDADAATPPPSPARLRRALRADSVAARVWRVVSVATCGSTCISLV
jgi:hypothetical protein